MIISFHVQRDPPVLRRASGQPSFLGGRARARVGGRARARVGGRVRARVRARARAGAYTHLRAHET